MNKPRRAFGWILTGLVLSATVEACSSSSSPDAPLGSAAIGGGAGTNMGDATIVEPVPSGGDGGESAYNPLCGVPSDGCSPDDSESCPDGLAGAGNESSGASGGTGGNRNVGTAGSSGGKAGGGGLVGTSGGGFGGGTPASGGGSGEGGEGAPLAGGNGGEAGVTAGEGGANPTPPSDPGGDGGSGGEGGAAAGESGVGTAGAGAGGDGGQSGGGTGSTGGSVPWPYSCQVRVTSSPEVASVCKPAGSGKVGDGCFSGADCVAGLGCVGEQSPGQCRPYCCEGSDSCVERGTHCTEQRLVGESARPRVPVCMPATGCDLADCAGGATCTCPEGAACVIVTGDGTTSCVPTSSLPSGGEGLAGAECPCAFGHFCSEATNRCVKLCQTSSANSGQGGAGGSGGTGCGRGRCQASPGLPTGWGVCIGSE